MDFLPSVKSQIKKSQIKSHSVLPPAHMETHGHNVILEPLHWTLFYNLIWRHLHFMARWRHSTIQIKAILQEMLRLNYCLHSAWQNNPQLLCELQQPINTQWSRTKTDLLRPANGQGVVVIRLLGVMIRAHFVDIESHVVPLLVARCPAWEQAQDQDAVQAHRPLAATWQVSYSTPHNPCCKDGQFISTWGTGVI